MINCTLQRDNLTNTRPRKEALLLECSVNIMSIFYKQIFISFMFKILHEMEKYKSLQRRNSKHLYVFRYKQIIKTYKKWQKLFLYMEDKDSKI